MHTHKGLECNRCVSNYHFKSVCFSQIGVYRILSFDCRVFNDLKMIQTVSPLGSDSDDFIIIILNLSDVCGSDLISINEQAAMSDSCSSETLEQSEQ